MAESVIDENDAVVVMDCDLEFKSQSFIQNIKEILSSGEKYSIGGLLVSFLSDLPRYSYALVDEQDYVIRTAEIEVISSHALCGAYFFSFGRLFLAAAHRLMEERNFSKPEYYVSLLYNYLLGEGETVRLCEMEDYRSYGTPEELKRYL